eukprot:TRINITY_DN22161_c0_g1_i1.p1 TRINITY_DN22161_c0_g1~~TRINITY_DN22161_c0_g1_i1.p1  ORF type:complete len:248 (-),score=38.17 TRINITY_DN22161_c0_g1_i1:79-822(-)
MRIALSLDCETEAGTFAFKFSAGSDDVSSAVLRAIKLFSSDLQVRQPDCFKNTGTMNETQFETFISKLEIKTESQARPQRLSSLDKEHMNKRTAPQQIDDFIPDEEGYTAALSDSDSDLDSDLSREASFSMLARKLEPRGRGRGRGQYSRPFVHRTAKCGLPLAPIACHDGTGSISNVSDASEASIASSSVERDFWPLPPPGTPSRFPVCPPAQSRMASNESNSSSSASVASFHRSRLSARIHQSSK